MENKKYQDEFEQFLQDEVKQHRMYPSDHIWKNIRLEMHGYKAWPALTFISLFIISALTISTLLINHPNQQLVKSRTSLISRVPEITPAVPILSAEATTVPNDNYFHQIAPEQITAETFADLNLNENISTREQAIVTPSGYPNNSTLSIPAEISAERLRNTEKMINKQLSVSLPQQNFNTELMMASTALDKEETVVAATTTPEPSVTIKETEQAFKVEQKKPEIHPTADDFLKDFYFTANNTPHKRNSKFGFQMYVTPSTSYRRLSDEKVKEVIQPAAAAAQIAPLSVNYSTYSPDVNNVVRHRPAVGLEVGFAILYNMSNKLKFKTGLQLNIRQYYIETFQSLTNDLTTLSLINYRGVETISFYSPYNNNTGYKKTQLDNKVYQVSVPMGIQWEMIQGKHFGITTEASVQPTLTLNTNTYLLSTDYKHYTDGSNFIRKWNINTSLGLNFTYQSGSTSWQIGPQIRYQHLPTYSNLYPIREYLIDYGVRLGFTKQIK